MANNSCICESNVIVCVFTYENQYKLLITVTSTISYGLFSLYVSQKRDGHSKNNV